MLYILLIKYYMECGRGGRVRRPRDGTKNKKCEPKGGYSFVMGSQGQRGWVRTKIVFRVATPLVLSPPSLSSLCTYDVEREERERYTANWPRRRR
jgi:hypothetical protein